MNKIGARRLIKLADFLQKVHHSKFNLNEWVSGINTKLMAKKPTRKGDCGTTACAVGWLPNIFPRSWSWTDGQMDAWGMVVGTEIEYKPWGDRGLSLTHNMKLNAAAEFFDIDFDESSSLFIPDEYSDRGNTTAKMVAKRIRSLVKGYGHALETHSRR